MSLDQINVAARTHLGFFLTTGPKTTSTTDEHIVVKAGVDVAVERLKEMKIRGSNILSNLPELKEIVDEVAKTMEASGDKNNFADCLENWTTYAHMIVFAAIANYNAKIQNYLDKKNSDKKKFIMMNLMIW